MTTTSITHRLPRLHLFGAAGVPRMSDAELAALLETLLQAERREAGAIDPFLDEAVDDIHTRLAHMQRVASHNIAALACLLRRFEARPREARPSLPDLRLTRASYGARLELLQRGQAWMARTIEHALPRIGDGGVRDALGVVRESHLLNIGVCRGILVDLGYRRFAAR
jgi:hypothetical protein